jgi:hypothetical protein
MARLYAFALFLAVVATESGAQDRQARPRPPEEVLNQYLEMINDGTLLTSQGWKKAALLFELPSPLPRQKLIYVTTSHRTVGKIQAQGNRVEVDENWVDPLGTIESSLRYRPPPKQAHEVEGTIFVYRLVLTNKHWEPAPDGGSPRESTGPQEWKIEGSMKLREVALDAAIRYVAMLRDKTTDPEVKRNADETLAVLKQRRVREQM